MKLKDNYRQLLTEVAKAAASCGRHMRDIKIIAVTKNQDWDTIMQAYEEGCRNFGENRVQEVLGKLTHPHKDLVWHFIGPLQKNKVNKVIGKFALIHSVDSLSLAKKISDSSVEAKTKTHILLQVNISGETSKQGFTIQECKDLLVEISALPEINIEGLMTIAPLTKDEWEIKKCFSKLRELRDELQENHGLNLPHLSMGMSNDFKIAIKEGATLLRIGSLIFD